MIAIINYGVGNIRAFVNIYKQLDIPVKIASSESDLSDVSKLILPGVGNFDYAMTRFLESGMYEKVNKLVTDDKVPIAGVCVGMQMMAKSSDEGKLNGLGWIDATVKKFDEKQDFLPLPIPHMGWNDLSSISNNPILTNLHENAKFYFLHSYYLKCVSNNYTIATSEYGIKFSCAVNHENIYGIQFHPEKSHKYGIQLLKNFAELC